VRLAALASRKFRRFMIHRSIIELGPASGRGVVVRLTYHDVRTT
jgi:hypothetical protein